ncbi:Ribonuclease YxiD [Streptococcus sanguinis]|uniref:Ribonuclease YxiD n=2 Tax=Streptococcus sanguinis TaxID=1305 RepID=A0AB74DWW5_STRSA|nr:Ribonuclease YxiD [Streptococcus sanguinis]RSI53585.1 Ribonuclease YxiD [Streptococcus sanguinis]
MAKGAKEAAEQAGKKARQEFSKEASEQLAKHSDDVAKGVKDAARQGLTNQFVESSFDGNLIKEYVKDVKLNTNRNIPNNQIEELKNALRLREYEKLSPVEVAKHRAEFNRLKNSLIDEWELKTGQTWPTYSEDVIGKNGNVVRKAGSKYDAHHIIENSYGGNNEWWNIHPARFPNEHQAGIHRAGSPARELFN